MDRQVQRAMRLLAKLDWIHVWCKIFLTSYTRQNSSSGLNKQQIVGMEWTILCFYVDLCFFFFWMNNKKLGA